MKKIHHDIEFTVLRKKLKNIGNTDDRIALLEQLVSLQPRNPKNLTLRKKYREEIDTLRLKKTSRKNAAVSPFEGIHYKRQAVLAGETNTGKSTLLNRLAKGDTRVDDSPYTTYKPEVRMMYCNGVPVQVVEVPALYDGDADTAKYRFIRNADVLCLCARNPDSLAVVIRQLREYAIEPVNSPSTHDRKQHPTGGEATEKSAFIAAWSAGFKSAALPVLDIDDTESISREIYRLLNIKRIFVQRNGEVQEKPPVFPADRETTVADFINALDKRLLKGFKRAKIEHEDPSAPEVQSVGLEYRLNDGDVVEIISD